MHESEATSVNESTANHPNANHPNANHQRQTEILPFTEAEVSDFSDPAGLIDLAEYVHTVPQTAKTAVSTIALTNSPGCTPAERSKDADAGRADGSRNTRTRHMRTVRVDAWAAPVSASWGRPRATVRKVNSQRMRGISRASAARSTDWALPF